MKKSYQYSAEREIRTYEYLRQASKDAFNKAKRISEGSFFQLMSCLVFSAFAVEAYLNHAGERKINNWSEIEKNEPLEKLRVMYSYLHLEFDPSKRPIQTIKQLFKFRNFMAHGRTKNIKASGLLRKPRPDPGEDLIETEWEKFCNENEAERAISDVKKVLEILCEAAGLEKEMLFSLGNGSHIIENPQP
jgi:hypothetical protein